MEAKFTQERNSGDKSITLSPKQPRYSIVWLHGLGDSSEGFLDWFKMPSSPLYSGARIRLLNAPMRKVTINGGMLCSSWYDIKTFDPQKLATLPDEKIFSVGEIEDSHKIVNKCVQEEAAFWKARNKNDPFRRVFVGGFSQGCAIALSYGLCCETPIAGIIGYSGHFFRSSPLTNLSKTPVLLYHGLDDQLLREHQSKLSYEKILKEPTASYKAIKQLGHSVDMEEMAGTVQWLSTRAPKD